MLILTRKIGESIVIGDNVYVTLLEIRGSQIRIGIKAPRVVKVYREEVYKQIVDENRKAARSTTKHDLKQLNKYLDGIDIKNDQEEK